MHFVAESFVQALVLMRFIVGAREEYRFDHKREGPRSLGTWDRGPSNVDATAGVELNPGVNEERPIGP